MSAYAFNKAMTDRIEILESQLVAAKAEIERLNDIGFKTERREQKYIEIMEQYRVETKRLRGALENLLKVEHGCEKGDSDYCCAQAMVVYESARAALDGGKA